MRWMKLYILFQRFKFSSQETYHQFKSSMLLNISKSAHFLVDTTQNNLIDYSKENNTKNNKGH